MTQDRNREDFNQSPIFEGVNLWTSDFVLKDCVKDYLSGPELENLSQFGAVAGSARALDLGRMANENPPKLRRFDQKGRRLDVVEYHPAYHELMTLSLAQGLHCSVWERGTKAAPYRHLHRCAGLYMAAQMEAGHCCPVTMTHAAFAVLVAHETFAAGWLTGMTSRRYDPTFRPAFKKESVTVGMGMTEKQGGTDLRTNTTSAVKVEGEALAYRITGHKWFMSAPMSDAFLILAQAPKGLSCFLLPRFQPDGAINGLHFQRLKDKLGNRSNASSEVEFDNAYGLLVGEEGRGIPVIMDMVTLTRLDCAISSVGLMRLALAVALDHAAQRTVFHKRLIDQPLMVRVLADLAIELEALTRLSFRLARAFDGGADELETALRRLMTPVVKYMVCKRAPAFVYEAMECLGGNGYVEEGLLARIYREVPVNAIWEGSGNVMCLDVLRVLKRSPETMETIVQHFSALGSDDPVLTGALLRLKAILADEARWEARARELVELLGTIAAATELRHNVPGELAEAYASSRLAKHAFSSFGASSVAIDANAVLSRARAETDKLS